MKKVFFLDIDDCLIHTSALTEKHLSAVKKKLINFGIKRASEITQEFARKEVKEPFESVMVSDSYSNNLIPAQKVGMEKLVLLVRHKNVFHQPQNNKLITIKSLEEI